MEKIELKILGISSGHTSTSYTLILEEQNGVRKLPIIIGAFEAQAIAIEIENIVPQRPMTHDLFKSFATVFDIEVKEIIIHRLHEGVFYSGIVCSKGTVEQEIDARTSDAIAIALRFKCPIYTYEPIMQEASIILSDLESESNDIKEEETQPVKSKGAKKDDLSKLSLEELNNMLADAIELENYIFAARIRDELKKRQENK